MDQSTSITPADPSEPVSREALRTDPLLVSATVAYGNVAICFRPTTSADAVLLGDYFVGLSADTRRRYGPHPFDRATAERLCATTDRSDTLRMIATIPTDAGEQAVAYMILILGIRNDDAERYRKLGLPLDAQTDCTLAPSVADSYQGKGLGSALMPQLKRIARQLAFRRMVLWGGTQATNDRAIHFYHKHGFRTVGEFEEPRGFNNLDMILDL